MKALILNCGPGCCDHGQLKCLMELAPGETILSRQLRLLCTEADTPEQAAAASQRLKEVE